MKWFGLKTLFLMAAVASGCGWRTPVPSHDPAMADLLWLPPQAQIQPAQDNPQLVRNGRSVYSDGRAAVSFLVEMPCDDLVGKLITQASSLEWHRRSTPIENPEQTLPTGNRCLQTTDGIMWAGEWDDPRGHVIRYSFVGLGAQLRGEARFMPHDLVVQASARPKR